MKSAVFITCRVGSSRLPGKAMKEILPSVELIRYIIRRMRDSRADEVVLCTTLEAEDDQLVSIAEQEKISVFRGSTLDKLERWRGAAERFGIDVFATADGDDPFCSPQLNDVALQMLSTNHALDFIRAPADLVCGGFTYAVRTLSLVRVCRMKGTEDTEMMWPYFEETGFFLGADLEPVAGVLMDPRLRLTVDYAEDLELARRLAAHGQATGDHSLENLVRHAQANPELYEINEFRAQEWRENQRRLTKIVLKDNDE